jgi:hypothetical protein
LVAKVRKFANRLGAVFRGGEKAGRAGKGSGGDLVDDIGVDRRPTDLPENEAGLDAVGSAGRDKKALRETLRQNKANSRVQEERMLETYRAKYEDVQPQITIRSRKSGRKVRIDVVYRREDGTIGLVELKWNDADLSKRQREIFAEIEEAGGDIAGRGKTRFEGKTHIPPTKVKKISERAGELKGIGDI